MPTYEYVCKDCGHRLEVFQSFSDDTLTTCPACAGTLRKVFGAVGISFKGSGFYKTDSRGTSKKAATSGDSNPSETQQKPADSPSTKGEGKSPSDSTAKTEPKASPASTTTSDSQSSSKAS